MKTAEMWLKAQENDRTYRSGDMYFSKDMGFVNYIHDPWPVYAFDSFEQFMGLNNWVALPEIPTMTRAEAESKLGVKIID